MHSGIIFDIREFAVHDGPGPRQTVFVKGCPLRCNWCHNPEGLNTRSQLMVSEASCTGCGACRRACKHETCAACGDCIAVCPLRLRRICGEEMSSRGLADLLLQNSAYYAAYGGGVTFSGGEPLLQADFMLETAELLPDVHIAVETSGYADASIFQNAIQRLDYIMFDIKVVDDTLHRKYTGVSNQLILSNLRQLCEAEKPFVVRIPVIPGVNDNEQNYRATARLLYGAKYLEKVELLPYHKTAGAKYAMAGMEYTPLFDEGRTVSIPHGIFDEYGIRSEVL